MQAQWNIAEGLSANSARRISKVRLATLLLACVCCGEVAAETTPILNTVRENAVPESSADLAANVHKTSRIDWVALPIPISNPTVGSGLALTTMALYSLKGAAQPSDTAVGVFKTDNGSSGVGFLQETYLGNNDWQLNGVLLKANLNLDFYGIGSDQGDQKKAIPINQDIAGGALWFMKSVIPGLLIGSRYRFDKVDISLDGSQELLDKLPFEVPPLNIGLTESTLELLVKYDTRDSRFKPSRGWFAEFSAGFTDKAIGSDISYQRYTLAGNWYHRLNRRLVLGVRASLCETSDSAPFFAMCQFGVSDDLRGYVVGRYRDTAMFATQAELRWDAWWRFGAVAFAGAGNVAPRFSDLSFSDPLTSVGVGLRYLASKANHINVGIDVAYAQDEYSFYFRIGEAF